MIRDGLFSTAEPAAGQTCNRIGRAVRRRLGFVLGLRFCRRAARRSHRHVAAGAGAAPLRLAGLCAHSDPCRERFRRSRRLGLAPRHRDYFVWRAAARAVELRRLRVCPARSRQHHSTLVRRGRRTRPGAPHPQRSAAAAAHRRRAEHRPWPRRDRRRGLANDGRAGDPRRSPVRRRGKFLCGFRHAAAALADCADARGGGDQRVVARRPADPVLRLRQFSRRGLLSRICCKRWCKACSPAPLRSIFSPAP